VHQSMRDIGSINYDLLFFVAWTGITIMYCLHVDQQTLRQGMVPSVVPSACSTNVSGMNGMCCNNGNYNEVVVKL